MKYAVNLKEKVCLALPVFHAFTGCDTTSSFHGKGKKSAWRAWKAYPEITSAFKFITDHPFTALEPNSPIFSQLERFMVVLYDKTSVLESVNKARRELFCKKNQPGNPFSNARCNCTASKEGNIPSSHMGSSFKCNI